MYSARKKKTERLRDFLHRHNARHRARHNYDYDSETTKYVSQPPRSQSASPPSSFNKDIDLIFFDDPPTTPTHMRYNTPPPTYEDHQSARFCSDYDRYMRMRDLNMQQIRELQNGTPANTYNNNSNYNSYNRYNNNNVNATTTTTTNPRYSTVSSVEQELLNLANTDASLPAYAYSARTSPSLALRHNAPYPQSSFLAPRPALSEGLSPRTELERFRTTFAKSLDLTQSPTYQSTRIPPTTTTTTYASRVYPRYEIPQEYKVYQHQHDKGSPPSTNVAKEYNFNPLQASCPGEAYESVSKPSTDPKSKEGDYSRTNISKASLEPSAGLLGKPNYDYNTSVTYENPYTIDESTPYFEQPPDISPIKDEPIPEVTVSEPAVLSPQATVSDTNGKSKTLQQDLENLLQNLEEHFKRRPSGIPKAPPPSPADAMSPSKYIGEAIFPDFDVTRDQLSITTSSPRTDRDARRLALQPRSLAFEYPTSPAYRSSSLSSSLETISPDRSNASSPTQFHSPGQSDSEFSTPPPSPPHTKNSTLTAPQQHSLPQFSPALPPPPPPLSPLAYYNNNNNNQEINCQGMSFTSNLPPPIAFRDIDLHSLPPPVMPPPDFDYSAHDFQGNRLDRLPEDEIYAPNAPNTQIAQIEQITPMEQIESIEHLEPVQQSDATALSEFAAQPTALHMTQTTTETSSDEFSKTVTATVTSNTATPTTIFSTISTATTTRSSTAIPTSPTFSSRDHLPQPTVIQTLSTVTTALEPETGKVANARVTQTKVLHQSQDDVEAQEEICDVTSEYVEGYLPSRPPSDAFSMGRLLDEIRNGKTLRKTPAPNYPSLATATPAPLPLTDATPSTPYSFENASTRTRAALANVLASRRAYISDDEAEEEEDEEEKEWLWV